MEKKLQNKLYKSYPKIFRQKDLPMSQTAMCWGISCGPGWFWLINQLCSALQFDIDKNNEPQIEAVQVKEKYGGLRFYTNGATDRQDGMIDLACEMSNSICEECGSTEKVTQSKGWIETRCASCRKKAKEDK